MNLISLYINGFGKFHDFQLTDFNPRLTILLGPNEAGKSTLMHFIRRILFGFPDKRNNANLYPPLDGGKHGGSLTFSRQDGLYTIERYSEEKNSLKVVYPDSSHQIVSNIQPWVGAVSSEVFYNIFAFSLDELQHFESLNSESIKDQLYSAGKGIGQLSLKNFQKSLDKKIGDLFKDKGTYPEINKIFKSITEISRKLNEIESESNRYRELQDEFETVSQDIDTGENKKKELKQQAHHVNSLLETWKDFRQVQESREKLSQIPLVKNFPEDGLLLMEKELEKKEILENGIKIKQDHLDRIRNVMNGLVIQKSLLQNQKLILEMQKKQEQVKQAFEDLPFIRKQRNNELENLNRLLKEIGTDWNAENFEHIDISISNKENVRKFQKQFESLQQIQQKKEQDREILSKEISSLGRNKTENDVLLQSISLDFESPEEAYEQRKDLSLLEEMLLKHESQEKEYRVLLEKEAMQNQIQSLQKPEFNLYLPIQIFLYILFGLILGGSLYSIISKNTHIAWILGFIYLPILFLFLIVSRQKKINRNNKNDGVGEDFYANRKISLVEEISDLKSRIGEKVEMLAFCAIPSKTEMDARRYLVHDQLAKLEKKQNLLMANRKLQTEIEDKKTDLNHIDEELAQFGNVFRQNEDAWQSFLEKNRLNAEFTPSNVLEVFNLLDTGMEKKKNIHGLQERIKAMEETVQRFQDRMSQLIRAIEQDDETEDWIPALERIIEALQVSSRNEAELKMKQAEEKASLEDLQILHHDLEKVLVCIQSLLDQGGAENEQEYRQNGETYRQRKELLQQETQCVNNLKRVSGEGTQYDSFFNELQECSYEGLIHSKDDLEEMLAQCEENLSRMSEYKGRITKEIEQIEKKEESSALRLEKSVSVEKANIMAREWSTLILAKSVMKKAIEEYEREKQPDVIKESQQYFSLMTLGVYPSIYSPLNEDMIYVEDRNRVRKDLKELSKGTAEQLYLSLRFGFIHEFTKSNEALPIIMDDILVNFDPKRFEACCEALQSLSVSHQILYFTCHPDSAEKMHRFIDGSNIAEIGLT